MCMPSLLRSSQSIICRSVTQAEEKMMSEQLARELERQVQEEKQYASLGIFVQSRIVVIVATFERFFVCGMVFDMC